VPNVFDATFQYDDEDPEGYRGGVARVGAEAGGTEQSVKLYELPPGQVLCPYHYEYVEEWLLMVEGALILRTPNGERPLARGELVCFPPGPAGGHKLWTAGDQTARFLMWSSSREPSVAVYPDGDKVGVWAGEQQYMFRGADGHLQYYDGEV